MTGAGEVLTTEQMDAMRAELAELEGPRRAAAIEAIATARAFGDLSENFEYHAAKNEQGLLEARITKLRARISSAVVVDHDTDDHVGPGSIVEIADDQGDVMEVTISSVGGGVSRPTPPGVGVDGQGRRGRRLRRGSARGVAGDGALDPPLVSERLAALQRREEERFAREHPRSRALAADAQRHLLAGVPMHWMAKWPGGFPLFVADARGSRFTDVDGLEYADFCLGDTGAMSGHAPEATIVPSPSGRSRDHDHAPDRGRALGRRGAHPALRGHALAVRADGD